MTRSSLTRARRAFAAPSSPARSLVSRTFAVTFACTLFAAAPVNAQSQAQPPTQPAALPKPDPVVITANRTPQPLSTVLADVSVVERADIERAGVTGLADLLARLPGIEFTRNGGAGGTTGVFIRGNENRHTAVYIDGVRVDSQSVGGAVWEQIPLEMIERIEVVRGPAAAVYGSDAVAGVVQLFTRRGQGPARPQVSLSLGSHGTVQGQAGVSGAHEALDYSLMIAAGRSGGFDAQTAAAPAHNPDDDGWRRRSLQARAGYRLDAVHRFEASWLASRLRSGYDGFVPGFDDENHHSLRSGSLAWQGRWSENATTRVRLGESANTFESRPDFYRTETTLRDLTLQHEQRLFGQWLTGTLERREDELFNPATAFGAAFGGQRHQDAIGLGWRGSFGSGGAHAAQAHLRHDDDSEFGGKGTGSLAWGWRFLPQWRLSASAATSFRVPTLYQRFSEYGNPTLVPESGRNVELGLRWADSDSEASVTAWRNKLTDLIAFGAAGPCASFFGCYENVDRARLDGLTLAGSTRLANLALRASLGWHDPRNLATGRVLPRRAKRLATVGAETAAFGWTFGGEVRAVGRRFDDAANTQAMGGCALVNLTAGTTLMPGLALLARIDNVADKDHETARTYATGGRAAQVTLRWTMP